MTIIPRVNGKIRGEFILSVLASVVSIVLSVFIVTFDYNTGHKIEGIIFLIFVSILIGKFTYDTIIYNDEIYSIELFFINLLFVRNVYKEIEIETNYEKCSNDKHDKFIHQNGLLKFLFIETNYIFNCTLCSECKEVLSKNITKFKS